MPRAGHRARGFAQAVKRIIDVAVAATLLLVTCPLQAVAALAILLEDGRPIMYRQKRVGRDGAAFDVIKLRSMRVNDVAPGSMGEIDPENPLVTRTGRAIRRLKVDELPQLVNVVRGEMSLVGPRPALPDQAAAYDGFERRRLAVRPGVTGWAQVNGNVTLSWPDRIALDVWYVDHWSLRLDLAVVVRTVAVVLRGERPNRRFLGEAIAHAHSSHWRS